MGYSGSSACSEERKRRWQWDKATVLGQEPGDVPVKHITTELGIGHGTRSHYGTAAGLGAAVAQEGLGHLPLGRGIEVLQGQRHG